MPKTSETTTETTTETAPPYDRDALYHPNGPFNPSFVREAVRAIMRTLPIDPDEPKAWADRRMHSALLGLSALHPRDEIEVMLGVQAMSAYHAACACYRIGMNLTGGPNGHSTRHISAATSAARAFETMVRALERRQARPMSAPAGRPAPRIWDDAPNPTTVMDYWAGIVGAAGAEPPAPPDQPGQPERTAHWTPQAIAAVHANRERARIEKENEGLDIANTEGILPGGGMILMEDPTPQQAAYMARRVSLMYKREIEENRRKGITKMPKIRGIRPGDLIP